MRARNIKPGFFKNEDLVECCFEARLLFAGLWCMADRAGRLEDRPKRIKMELFPADNVDCDAMMEELRKWGFVIRYEADGEHFIQIVNFHKHQTPHVKEAPSTIPCPDKYDDGTVQAPDKHQTSTVLAPPDSLIPDSLIPDSLIPDSLIPDSLIPDSKTYSANSPLEPNPEISASDDAERKETEIVETESKSSGECLISKKGQKINGWKQETFLRFWEAFDFKKGRAEAAQAWIDIKGLTPDMAERIIEAAGREARARPDILRKGRTPKWAQGWLAGRRWEDEDFGVEKERVQAEQVSKAGRVAMSAWDQIRREEGRE